MALTEAGAMALSAVGSLGSNLSGGLFNINQAKKNRAFQERMFNRQIEVNRENWMLENQWNLPSAQVQRLKDANLNPYLMYSNGASGLTSQGSIGNPSAPSGAQAQASFTNPFLDALQAKLATAQVDKLEAETQKTVSETDWQNIENRFSSETYMVRKAIQFGNWDMLKTSMDKMRQDMLNSINITTQQVLTMAQARIYEIKRFDLDNYTRGQSVLQEWDRIGLERQGVAQGWKALALDMRRVANETKMTNAQVGALQWQVLSDKAMFGERWTNLSLQNKLLRWDTHLKKAGLQEQQVKIWNGVLKNYYLQNTGNEQIGNHITDMPAGFWQAGNKPMPEDLLVVPDFLRH